MGRYPSVGHEYGRLYHSAQASANWYRTRCFYVGAEPSPGLKERLEEALRLYRNGTVQRLIVSGGLDKPDFPYTEAEGMQRYLVDRGSLYSILCWKTMRPVLMKIFSIASAS